jgi:hypothetical protein
MAKPAPSRHSKLRATVQEPAEKDQIVIPAPRIAPMLIRAQGLASYKLCGNHRRIRGILPATGDVPRFVYNPVMYWPKQPWIVELIAAGVLLGVGVTLMPILIFYVGVATLGRYEGAGVGALFSSVLNGLKEPSLAAWLVILGPYMLYLLFRGLRAWWRAGAQVA